MKCIFLILAVIAASVFLVALIAFFAIKRRKIFPNYNFCLLNMSLLQTNFSNWFSIHKIYVQNIHCSAFLHHTKSHFNNRSKEANWQCLSVALKTFRILENFYFDRSVSRCILAFRIKNILLRKLRVKIFLTKYRALTSLANEFSHTRSSLLFCQKSRKKKCYCNILSIFTAFFCVFETTSSIYKN